MAENLSNQGAGRRLPTLAALLCLAAALLLSLSAAKVKPVTSFDANDYSQIRVVLSDNKTYVEVGGALNWQIRGKSICDSTAVAEIRLVDSNTVKLVLGKKGWSGERIVAVPKKGFLRFGGREYRGRMEFYPSRDGDTVIALNVLPLEDYLLGVVPAEMPSAWPAEALKAQSVAARTYAVFEMREKRTSSKSYSFDVYPDQSDQVYKGVSGEDPRASKAVQETAGVILTYQGKPIFAQFCADCGGSTKCGTQPYLQAVPCYAPDSPYNDWSLKLSPEKLASLAKAAGGGVGTVREVRAENDAASGHLKALSIVGDSGSQKIGGNKLRELLGLSTMKSTRAYVSAPGGAALEPESTSFAAAEKGGTSKSLEAEHRRAPLEATHVLTAVADSLASDDDGDGFIPDAGDEGTSRVEVASKTEAAEPAALHDDPAEHASMVIDLPRLQDLDDYSRPAVRYGNGVADLKLRSAFIFDGEKLRKPPQRVSVLGTESSLETAEYDIQLDDEPAGSVEPQDSGDIAPVQDIDPAETRAPAAQPQAARQPAPPSRPQKVEPKFELSKQPQSEIPPSSRVKVGKNGIELRGSGYGHGVGLSQWGARELATQGLDYLSILLHFYTGVEVFTIPTPEPAPAKGKKGDKKKASAETADPGEAVDVFYQPFQP